MTISAKEMLDCRIGAFTTLRAELLKSAAKENGCLIPANWRTNKGYTELEAEGLVAASNDVTSNWQRRWIITDAGRAHLNTPVEPARTSGTSSQGADSDGAKTGGGG